MTAARRVMAGVLAAALVGAACSGSDDSTGLPPTTALDPVSTTTTVDFSSVALPEVRGVTTTTGVAIEGGRAAIGGLVSGPDGPAVGAVVRVERLVGDAVGRLDVPVGPDGVWRLREVLGGRYRVRAWRVPDLAMADAEILFVQGTEQRVLNLALDDVGGITVKAAMAPDPPVVGRPAELRVLVAFGEVDVDGVVRGVPQPGAIAALLGAGAWDVDTANPTRADTSGVARWVLRCQEEGDQPLSVEVETSQAVDELSLTLPACAPAPRATTTTAVEPPSSSTTTTRPSTTTSSTSP